VTDTPEAPATPGIDDRLARRLDAVRVVIGVLLAALGLTTLAGLLDGSLTAPELIIAVLVVGLGFSLLLHHRIVTAQAARRTSRETSMTRILQGLSRSLSPESVVDAIIAELRTASGVDHVVVARVRQPDRVVEVTLVAASTSVPASRTTLRPEVAELSTDRQGATAVASTLVADGKELAPAGAVLGSVSGPAPRAGRAARLAFQAAADEIARRVRSAYGLPYTLAEPLIAERRFLGALLLSKRTRDEWGDADRRLLGWAAGEVSAAFARAYVLEEAERGANIDALTGLPNRRYFDELLSIMRPRRRTTDSLGVLMVDIDHFKKVNDQHGHAAGDEVLRAVAGAIAATIRAEDTPARYGGEEFAVILRRASAGQATDVGDRVRQAVAVLPGERLGIGRGVTVSVGVAVAAAGEDISLVVERADRALYLAKRRGRDRVEVG
jgi:diguanylate cyclase (GGDEF)-like protein